MYDPNKSYTLEELIDLRKRMADLTDTSFGDARKKALIAAVEIEKKRREIQE